MLNEVEHYIAANCNILVVEDDRIMGQMINDALGEAGFNVITVSNGQTALAKLQQQPAHFILLDLSLPGMNGFEIFTKLQDIPETKDIPVIMATAWDDDRNLEQASQLGIRHILSKPFTEDELLHKILSLLLSAYFCVWHVCSPVTSPLVERLCLL